MSSLSFFWYSYILLLDRGFNRSSIKKFVTWRELFLSSQLKLKMLPLPSFSPNDSIRFLHLFRYSRALFRIIYISNFCRPEFQVNHYRLANLRNKMKDELITLHSFRATFNEFLIKISTSSWNIRQQSRLTDNSQIRNIINGTHRPMGKGCWIDKKKGKEGNLLMANNIILLLSCNF